MWIAPAILTVCTWSACESTSFALDGAESRRVGARETTAGNFLDFPAIPVLDEGFHFRVRPRTGGEADPGSWSENGPWRGLDQAGVLTESGVVSWNEIASPDRLRLGREILRRTGRDRDPGSAASLAIILTVIEPPGDRGGGPAGGRGRRAASFVHRFRGGAAKAGTFRTSGCGLGGSAPERTTPSGS